MESADHVVAVDQDRDEVLAADLAHGRAVGGVDVDGLDLEALVSERERDALDVGGVAEAVEAEHGAASVTGAARARQSDRWGLPPALLGA